jgi:hypothetical protein
VVEVEVNVVVVVVMVVAECCVEVEVEEELARFAVQSLMAAISFQVSLSYSFLLSFLSLSGAVHSHSPTIPFRNRLWMRVGTVP